MPNQDDPSTAGAKTIDGQEIEPVAKPTRRDDLALMRTDLANERTLLAYARTSLMFAATALTIVKFFPEFEKIELAAYGLGTVSVLCVIAGLTRFVRMKRRMRC